MIERWKTDAAFRQAALRMGSVLLLSFWLIALSGKAEGHRAVPLAMCIGFFASILLTFSHLRLAFLVFICTVTIDVVHTMNYLAIWKEFEPGIVLINLVIIAYDSVIMWLCLIALRTQEQ